MNNYRPISNLSFVSSKLLELHVPLQLRQTTTIYRTFFKSAYCQHHSTETAFARIQNDHLNSADRKSAAGHERCVLPSWPLIVNRPDAQHRSYIEMAGIVHIEPDSHSAHWQSQLAQNADRIRHPIRICVGPSPLLHLHAAIGCYLQKASTSIPCLCRWRPTVCWPEWTPVGWRNCRYSLSRRTMHWRSETVDVRPKSPAERTQDRSNYLQDVSCVSEWYAYVTLCHHRPCKTSGLWSTVNWQCRHRCRASAYYHLYAISTIRHCLTTEACKTLVYVLVITRLEYGNAMLYGITAALMTKLQKVQNSAARLIARQRKHQHITPVLIKLHWLPVRWRVQCQLLVLVFCLVRACTKIHSSSCNTIRANRNLRSAYQCLLVVPRYNLAGYDRRAFKINGKPSSTAT